MRLPEILVIKGKIWRVQQIPDLHMGNQNLYGVCIPTKRLIQLNSDYPRADIEETLLHEVMHACLPVRMRGVTMEAEERLISRMTPELMRVLPGLFKP